MQRNKMRQTLGFTLIEVMVVTVIIGILAAVAVPSYRRYVIRARAQEPITLLPQIRLKQEMFFAENSEYVSTPAYPALNTGFMPDLKVWDSASTDGKTWQGDLGFRPSTPSVYFQYWSQRVTLDGTAGSAPTGISAADTTYTTPGAAQRIDCYDMIPITHYPEPGDSFVVCARGDLNADNCGATTCPMVFGMSGVNGRSRVYYRID
ncbi:MAG: prepilin-type N-terminal cleavage/methylation domain-containing protein [Myxococcota bacterium]